VPNGTDLPGTSCDDGNVNTANDTWSAACVCEGTPTNFDCLGVSGGAALPGTSCDDGNVNTANDLWSAACVCEGTPINFDCLGVSGGVALPGTSCDDGNVNTTNDTWSAACVCEGTPTNFDCLGVSGGAALPGTSCDDGNVNTTNDLWDANCTCVGQVVCEPVSIVGTSGGGTHCAGGSFDLGVIAAGTAPYVFHWSGPGTFSPDTISAQVTVTNGASGVYTVVVENACGMATSTIDVTVAPVPAPVWAAPTSVCNEAGVVDLTTLITGTSGGSWSGVGVSGGVFDPAGLMGPIDITYSFGAPCPAASTQSVVVTPSPVAQAGPDGAVCGLSYPLEALLDVAPGTWSGAPGVSFTNDQSPNATATVPVPGTYAFVWTVGDAGCSDTDTVLVTFQDPTLPVLVDAGQDQELDVTNTTQLNGSVAPGAEVTWSLIQGGGNILSPSDTGSWVTDLAMGTNILMLTASIGDCAQATDTVMITVNDVFIPQGFSPDGDGVNDVFEITGIRAFPGNRLAVFNRWGQPVLDRTDYQNDWNGHGMNGEPLPNDTYFYVLNLTPDRAYNGFVIIKR